jgi:GrpB-like predicted nucleotidyltransferase (UPF0157 family)
VSFPNGATFAKVHKHDTFNLHMVEVASEFLGRHLAFRDYLRTHPETTHAYEALKRSVCDE